jgi:hypothetical protein
MAVTRIRAAPVEEPVSRRSLRRQSSDTRQLIRKLSPNQKINT